MIKLATAHTQSTEVAGRLRVFLATLVTVHISQCVFLVDSVSSPESRWGTSQTLTSSPPLVRLEPAPKQSTPVMNLLVVLAGLEIAAPCSTSAADVEPGAAISTRPPNATIGQSSNAVMEQHSVRIGAERSVGEAPTPEKCAALVQVSELTANGATYSADGNVNCYAEFGMSGSSDSSSRQTCTFDSMPSAPTSTCQYTNDGDCDVPAYCLAGSDEADCSGTRVKPVDADGPEQLVDFYLTQFQMSKHAINIPVQGYLTETPIAGFPVNWMENPWALHPVQLIPMIWAFVLRDAYRWRSAVRKSIWRSRPVVLHSTQHSILLKVGVLRPAIGGGHCDMHNYVIILMPVAIMYYSGMQKLALNSWCHHRCMRMESTMEHSSRVQGHAACLQSSTTMKG